MERTARLRNIDSRWDLGLSTNEPLLGDWIVIDNDDGVDSLSNF